MKDRVKTLIVDSNGAGWKSILLDTVIRGFLDFRGTEKTIPLALAQKKLAQKILGQRYEVLSYAIDWREAICQSPYLDAKVININNFVEYCQSRQDVLNSPLIIILHSAAGDSMAMLNRTASWFRRRAGKLVMFIGNEYDLMNQKLGFIKSAGVDYVCSQLPRQAAEWQYASCKPAKVLPLPHALNPQIYKPDDKIKRDIDLGFRGCAYPYFLGDTERTGIISYFKECGQELGLKTDVDFVPTARGGWSTFLQQCKGMVGGEAGTYYLDHEGQIIANAKAYVQKKPQASFDEVFDACFSNIQREYVSGKAISSRHFESIGTKTCQMLLEGHYNGLLKPDEHYIAIKKDKSNIQEAVRKFKDKQYRTDMADATYEYVMDCHTYRHRVDSLLQSVGVC